MSISLSCTECSDSVSSTIANHLGIITFMVAVSAASLASRYYVSTFFYSSEDMRRLRSSIEESYTEFRSLQDRMSMLDQSPVRHENRTAFERVDSAVFEAARILIIAQFFVTEIVEKPTGGGFVKWYRLFRFLGLRFLLVEKVRQKDEEMDKFRCAVNR